MRTRTRRRAVCVFCGACECLCCAGALFLQHGAHRGDAIQPACLPVLLPWYARPSVHTSARVRPSFPSPVCPLMHPFVRSSVRPSARSCRTLRCARARPSRSRRWRPRRSGCRWPRRPTRGRSLGRTRRAGSRLRTGRRACGPSRQSRSSCPGAVRCSAVQCSAVQCSAVQCSAVLQYCSIAVLQYCSIAVLQYCSIAVQYSAVQCSVVQCSAVSAVQCSAVQHSACERAVVLVVVM
jgi:hypothetical protein